MNNTRNQLMGMVILCLFFTLNLNSQENPVAFVTVTTTHWNFDNDEGSGAEWEALEQEWHEKVTMKNEHILFSQFLTHFYTADNSEVLLVNGFASWEGITAAQARTGELVEEGWPDEAERDAFFKKRDAYYKNVHKDEIYAALPHVKPLPQDTAVLNKSLIFYVQTHHVAFPEDGSGADFDSLQTTLMDATINQNENVLGYYTYRHAWGADNREFTEVRMFHSLSDLEASNPRNFELLSAKWPDAEDRSAFFDSYDRYFTGWHGDFLYRNVPELQK